MHYPLPCKLTRRGRRPSSWNSTSLILKPQMLNYPGVRMDVGCVTVHFRYGYVGTYCPVVFAERWPRQEHTLNLLPSTKGSPYSQTSGSQLATSVQFKPYIYASAVQRNAHTWCRMERVMVNFMAPGCTLLFFSAMNCVYQVRSSPHTHVIVDPSYSTMCDRDRHLVRTIEFFRQRSDDRAPHHSISRRGFTTLKNTLYDL